ncbi:MAG: hypothetical protein AAF431_03555 [Pseudomonadota bacterium]
MRNLYRQISLGLVAIGISLTTQQALAQTFEWSSAGLFDGESIDGAVVNATMGPVTMTASVNVMTDGDGGPINLDAFSAGGEGPASYEDDGSFGGLTNYVQFGFDMTTCDTDDFFEIELDFSATVNNLEFTVADVDQGSWDDVLEFFADVDGFGFVNLKTLMTDTTTGAPFLSFGSDVEEDNEGFADGYEGTTSISSASTDGNIDFDSNGTAYAFNSITLRYRSGDDGSGCGGNPGAQLIGLGDVTFDGTTVPVSLIYFNSVASGELATLEWQTAQEVGHAGFQIYARRENGWELLTEQLIQSTRAANSLQTNNYTQLVSLPDSDTTWLSLVDVSVNEELVAHGPFRLGKSYGAKLAPANSYDWRQSELPEMSLVEKRNAISNRLRQAQKQEALNNGGQQ